MSMTLGEMKAAVLSTVGAEYIADIVRYLNKGLLELSSNSRVLTRADVTISSGAFSVPSDCLIVKDVFVQGSLLKRYGYTDIPDSATGTPLAWLQDGNSIRVYPEPNSDLNGQIVYVKQEARMKNDDDTHDLNNADDFLIAFAKWKVLVDTKGLTEEAMYWRQEAENEKAIWKKLNSTQNRRPRKVRTGRWC